MKRILILIFALFLFKSSMVFANEQEIDVGDMINKVISGEDFVGKDMILSGIVLAGGSTDLGLINLGTLDTYNSPAYENFVSIYETKFCLYEGSKAKILAHVESSEHHKVNGKDFVIIEAVYKKCLSCKKYPK